MVDGKESVMIVVDLLLKYVVFIIATKNCFVNMAAELFFSHAVQFFCLFVDSVSNCNQQQPTTLHEPSKSNYKRHKIAWPNLCE